MLAALEKTLLFLTILFLPSQLSLHLWPEWSFINGIPVDYLSPTLYFTDILILLMLTIWFFRSRPLLKISPLIIIIASLNLIFSYSPYVTIYRLTRLCIYAVFGFYLVRFRSVKLLSLPLLLAGLWSSLLAILQFLHQSSLGGVWTLLGERPLTLASSAIAKISLGNIGLFLRPYSTLAHPNSLAGFLSVLLCLNIYLHRSERRLYYLVQALIICAILLTFSRTIIFIGLIMLFLVNFRKKLLWLAFPLIAVLFLFPGYTNSLPLRISQIKPALAVISANPLFGVGTGSFLPYTGNALTPQIHLTYLLLCAELGVAGIITLFALLKRFDFTRLPRVIKLCWVLVIISAIFDHYWYTIPQNILLITILISLSIIKSHDI